MKVMAKPTVCERREGRVASLALEDSREGKERDPTLQYPLVHFPKTQTSAPGSSFLSPTKGVGIQDKREGASGI